MYALYGNCNVNLDAGLTAAIGLGDATLMYIVITLDLAHEFRYCSQLCSTEFAEFSVTFVTFQAALGASLCRYILSKCMG